ncbi:PREDICTED: protein FAM166A [Nipponia nippon]|uniref:protein FAM166A n=1 Tax=Nipponia nippon TaxID=128390 RepID=UPI000510A37E|nr:PREDICTED: protein FAM166A [Nipponia nippon]
MAAPKENSLFPPSPYYLPGYEGFIPQYNYQCGETFGKTVHRLLTDPGVTKSPRPLLAPLRKPKFVEDFSGTKHGVQGYLPGRPGYFPYEKAGAATSFPERVLGPKPPPPAPGPAEEELMMTHVDPVPQHHPGEYIPRTRLPWGYPRRISCYPASEGREWRLPKLTPACGQGKTCGPSQPGGALAGSKPPVKIEDVTLPGVAETTDVERGVRLPELDVPNVIQQKVISGYSGFIPRLTWINGVNYIRAVKEAMDEFDRLQFLQRNAACGFGRGLPQTYWPNNRIYTSAGLIPSYSGFVPDLRNTYALTFGNGTRKAYQNEERRRACAL